MPPAPAVEAIPVEVPPQKLLIGGEWVDATGGGKLETLNPATGEPITTIAKGTAADVDRAVKAARAALDGAWSKLSPGDRGRAIWRLGDLLLANHARIATLETLDAGKPIGDTIRIDVPLAADCFQYYAGWATKIQGETLPVRGNFLAYTRREPVGVVGAIIPWNFPLLMAAWKIAPALAAGNTIVLKPASWTPLTALEVGRLSLEAGIPAGVVNILTGPGGEIGKALVEHPQVDKIALTGGTSTGQDIMRRAAAGMKKISLELGGKSPNIVFADADLEAAAKGALIGIFYNQGEVCTAGSRLLVEEKAHDALLERLVAGAGKMAPGDPRNPKTRMGPLISAQHRDEVWKFVESGKKEGAKCVLGGTRPDGPGYFLPPTIFDRVPRTAAIYREEIFGPVLSVVTFKDEAEAVALANESQYGLAAAVWSRDIGKAHRVAHRLQAGTVWINTYNVFDSAAPFGGYKMSGFGRENGGEVLDMYTQLKTVWVELG